NEIRNVYNMPPVEGGDIIADRDGSGGEDVGDPRALSFSTPTSKRVKQPKVLRGRPILRKKFELMNIMKKELINSGVFSKKTKEVKKEKVLTSMFSEKKA